MTLIDYDVSGVWVPPRERARRTDLTEAQDRYSLYTVADLAVFPPVEWLVPGYLAARELTVLWGSGGTYKSFMALALGAMLDEPVVYIAAEGASGIQARLWAWMKHHGRPDLPDFYVMPSNLNMHHKDEVTFWNEAVRDYLAERKPALVVVDTLARNFVGGSENDPQDMGQFVDGLERVRREQKAAVLVIHHSTKEGKTERGTESLRNASFASFKLTKAGGTNRAADVKCDRMKDAEFPPEARVPLVKVELPELGSGESSLVFDWPYSPPNSPRPEGAKRGERWGRTSAPTAQALETGDGGERGGESDRARAGPRHPAQQRVPQGQTPVGERVAGARRIVAGPALQGDRGGP